MDTSVDTVDGMGIVMMMDGDAAILIKSHIVLQTEMIFNRNIFEHLKGGKKVLFLLPLVCSIQ